MCNSTNPAKQDLAGLAARVRLSCRDLVGRHRHLVVSVRESDLILHVPPGEVAILDARGMARLVEALQAADVILGTASTHRSTHPLDAPERGRRPPK